MNILFIPSWYPNSKQPNLGRYFKDQIALLAKSGVRTGVVVVEDLSLRFLTPSMLAPQHFQTRNYEENGVTVYRQHGWHMLPFENIVAARLWIRQMLRLIDRYIAERGKPDLLHALVAFPAGYAAQLAAERHNIPYVITEHSSMYLQNIIQPWKREPLQSALGSAAAVAAVSETLAGAIEPFAKQKSVVIPNFIDTEFFTPPPNPRTTSPFVFLAVGNLLVVKGYDLLLQAFAHSFSDNLSVQLRIAGHGPELGSLRDLALKLGIQERVIFTGQLSPYDVRMEMWNANALVISSRHETFSIALIEALATGLPVVSTRAGGPQEIINEQVGILVPQGDTAALAEGMEHMIDASYDPRLLREYTVRKYSPGAVIDQFNRLYSRVLDSKMK